MSDTDVPSVTADQAQQLIADGWAVIDVRTDDEWAQGHITGSQHLPLDKVVEQIATIGNQVVCVCAVGGRSWRATQYLTLQGLDAVNLDGGIQGWTAAGYPLER